MPTDIERREVARSRVTEARRALDRAIWALSVPGPDWDGAMRAARDCAEVCHALELRLQFEGLEERGTK